MQNVVKVLMICFSLMFTPFVNAQESQTTAAPKIHIIFFGGNDCLNCVQWRRFDLTKLEGTPSFLRHKFTNVVKMFRSPVPAAFFMPNEIRQFKEKLDFASNGLQGSPQMAIMVNDEVFDYRFAFYSADEIELIINAIETNSTYPAQRCTKWLNQWTCAVSH